MILLLLTCSTSWCQSKLDDPDNILITGDVSDTNKVLVPISAIRIANAKMVELNYEKEINANYREAIYNDSLIIDAISTNLSACENSMAITVDNITKQRNLAIGIGAGTSVILLILLIIAL